MKLSERLAKAMEHARLNQIQLATNSKVSQQTISKILLGKQKKSADLVKLALACGVRAEWLSEEDGEMEKKEPVTVLYSKDPAIQHATMVMEKMEEVVKYEAVKEIDSLAEFAAKLMDTPRENGEKG